MSRWVAKVKHYRGGESVLGYYEDLGLANKHAAEWNDRYQTDNAYVEAWDEVKAWPTWSRREHENGLLR